mgnify:CR=1 FL=1
MSFYINPALIQETKDSSRIKLKEDLSDLISLLPKSFEKQKPKLEDLEISLMVPRLFRKSRERPFEVSSIRIKGYKNGTSYLEQFELKSRF